jgi:hypothetical protein
LQVSLKPNQVAPLWGRLLVLLANVRLGWKGLPGTNATAYFSAASVKMKYFDSLETWAHFIKLFTSVIYSYL